MKFLILFFLLTYILLSLVCLISTIIATVYGFKKIKAIDYIGENKRYCGKNICPDRIYEINTIPVQQEPNSYQEDMSRYTSNLVSIVSNNKINDNNPKGLENIKLLYNLKDKEPFGVIWKDNTNNVLFIVLRGTEYTKEWIQDLDSSQSKYNIITKNKNKKYSQVLFALNTGIDLMLHSGFIEVYENIRNDIIDTVNKLGPSKIIVCGHSLGAAVSTICGVDLFMKGYNTITYNFASPRVGDVNFCKLIKSNNIPIYRLVNEDDIIPTLPPSIVPNLDKYNEPYFYTHCGEQKTFSDNRFSYTNNHIMTCYKDYLFGKNNDLKIVIDNKK